MLQKLHFAAKILIHNGNPYVHVEACQAAQLQAGWRKPLPVLVKINGKPGEAWRINMMPMGNGDFYLYLHGEVRAASRTKVGDTVQVELAFDRKYHNGPQHPLPTWFEAGLSQHPTAQKNWINLPPSRQKEILRYFSWLKSPEAKQRNLEKALHVLSGKPGRFMARDWESGK